MKRILIINVVLVGEKSGTGHTLENIYSNYAQDNIMQLSLQVEPEQYETTVKNTIFINRRCIPVDSVFRYFFSKKNSKRDEKIAKSQSTANIPQKNIKGALHDFVRGILDMSFIILDKNIISSIDRFNPDVIYTCGSTIRVHKFANKIAVKYGIPIILHLMDDWPETIYTSSFLSYFAKRSILLELKKSNFLSVKNFAISEALCSKYEYRFKKTYIPLMNPAKKILDNAVIVKKDVINFVYAGALSLNRWKSLIDIASAINEINKEKIYANLELYVPSSWNNSEMSRLFGKYNVKINDYVANEKVYEVYDKSDVLIHVESFDENYRRFTKYSLSTKIPEYMGAGKPILAYLPKELHGSDYISKNNAGLVVNDKNDLIQSISNLIENSKLRQYLADQGLACAKEKHSIHSVNFKLLNTLEGL